jgi:hypothetical protein
MNNKDQYLFGRLVVFGVVLFAIAVRAEHFLEFGADNQARTNGARPAGEKHDASAGIWKRALAINKASPIDKNHLQKADGNRHGDAGAPLRTLVVVNGPRILLQLLQNRGQGKFALTHRQQKAKKSQFLIKRKCTDELRWRAAEADRECFASA